MIRLCVNLSFWEQCDPLPALAAMSALPASRKHWMACQLFWIIFWRLLVLQDVWGPRFGLWISTKAKALLFQAKYLLSEMQRCLDASEIWTLDILIRTHQTQRLRVFRFPTILVSAPSCYLFLLCVSSASLWCAFSKWRMTDSCPIVSEIVAALSYLSGSGEWFLENGTMMNHDEPWTMNPWKELQDSIGVCQVELRKHKRYQKILQLEYARPAPKRSWSSSWWNNVATAKSTYFKGKLRCYPRWTMNRSEKWQISILQKSRQSDERS